MNKLILLIFTVVIGLNVSDDSTEEKEHKLSEEIPQKMLLGEFQRKALEKKPYAKWFKNNYNSFEPEDDSFEVISENISDYEITLVMGTWCKDSKREVPKFYKIIDEAGYDSEKIKIIGVNYYKEAPDHIEQELNVHRIPTIIFYKDGKEVNRFVEFPVDNLEKDLAEIVSGKNYKHVYSNYF